MDNPYQSPQADPSPMTWRRLATLCPHCEEPAASLFQKSRIGPFQKRRCRTCGDWIGVSWKWVGLSILAALIPPVLLVAGVALADFGPPTRRNPDGSEAYWLFAYWAIGIVGALSGGVQVAVLTFAAPLVKK